MQVVAKGMMSRGTGGAIVNVSSTVSKVAVPDHTLYCATKGALDQITRVMALELGPHKVGYFILFHLFIIIIYHDHLLFIHFIIYYSFYYLLFILLFIIHFIIYYSFHYLLFIFF